MTFPDLSKICIGPDVSNLNGRALDATLLSEYAFAIYKVGQGLLTGGSAFDAQGLDVQARANDVALLTANKLRARYFFLERGNGAAQAQRFMQLTTALGDVAHVGHGVDIEKQNATYGPLLADIMAFLTEWQTLGGPPIGGYSARWYWSGYLGNPAWPSNFSWLWDGGSYISPPNAGDPLTVLQSGGSDGQGVTPGYWNTFGGKSAYSLRQYTSSATCGGITPCDVSVFPGTVADLATLWGIGVAPPPPPPPPNPTPTPMPPPPAPATQPEDDDMYVAKNGSGYDQWQVAGNTRVYIGDLQTLSGLVAKFPNIQVSTAFLTQLPIVGVAPAAAHHAAFAAELATAKPERLRRLGYAVHEIDALHAAARRANPAEETKS